MKIDYFDTWTIPMAYYLGWIWADGSISDKKLQLGCVTEDEELLVGFLSEISSSRKITRKPARMTKFGLAKPYSQVSIDSKPLIDALKNHGLRPRKTYLDLPMPLIPDKFFCHFTRGYFETIAMKYVFTLPNLVGVNTDVRLFLGHQIHLTSNQRKHLQTYGAEIDVTGICIPTWVGVPSETESPEIFYRYKIIHSTGDRRIDLIDERFIIHLQPGHCRSLNDIRDGGSAWLHFVLLDLMSIDDKTIPAIHQTVIAGIEELERSMVAVHLPQTVSR